MKLKHLFIPLIFSLALIACEDDEDDSVAPITTPTTNNQTKTACNGGDGFCMNYGGTNKEGDAKLIVQSSINKIRVYWTEGMGNDYEQVELDIFSLTTGTFPIGNGSNTSGIEYFSAANGANEAAYGTVTVTKLDTIAGVTGTFEVTMNDSTKVTGGVFKNIVK